MIPKGTSRTSDLHVGIVNSCFNCTNNIHGTKKLVKKTTPNEAAFVFVVEILWLDLSFLTDI